MSGLHHSADHPALRLEFLANMIRPFAMLFMICVLLLTDSALANISSNTSNSANANSFPATDFDKKTLLGGIKFEGINELRTSNTPTKFIPADQAFKLVGDTKDNNKLVLDFQVTSGYYLYQRKFAYYSSNSTVKFQDAIFNHSSQIKDDPEFGKVPVYHDDVSITVPYSGSGKVTVRWQGCADAGLCYPPQEREFNLPSSNPTSVATSVTSSAAPVDAANVVKPTPVIPNVDGRPDIRTKIEKSAGVQSILLPLPMPNEVSGYGLQLAPINRQEASPRRLEAALTPLSAQSEVNTDSSTVLEPNPLVASASTSSPVTAITTQKTLPLNTDPFGLGRHPLTAFALLFLAGLGLAFTPCVLPMLPIVANLVARQHRRSMAHGLLLSGAYAVGVASCYAVLGAVIAKFGQQFNLLGWLQNPVVLIGFALVFVALALANFDVFTLRLPQSLQSKIHEFDQRDEGRAWLQQGSVLGSGLTGFVSALVVSPCVSAPLAGVLLSVSTVGSPLLGAIALFMLGLGLGVPLMILGATEGRFLPRAGEWLNWVRQGFGLLLLGVALILLNRAFDNAYILLLWAALSMACAVWFWRWAGRGRFVTQVCAVMLAGWGLVQLAGVAAGQSDPWHPLAGLQKQPVAVQTAAEIHSLAELSVWQQQHPKLLVDVTADWCVSCRIMERELFSGQDIKGLSGWTRVKLDVTESDENSKEVLKKLNLFGPPALIFYQQGQEVGRVVGETHADGLAQVLAKL